MAAWARRGFSLVEIMVVLVIMLVLMAVLAPRYFGGGKGKDGKPIASPMQRARSTECINNLSQLRNAYRIASIDEEAKPQTVQELGRGFPQSMFQCPVGKQPYQYDPNTGRVACVQPGHETY